PRDGLVWARRISPRLAAHHRLLDAERAPPTREDPQQQVHVLRAAELLVEAAPVVPRALAQHRRHVHEPRPAEQHGRGELPPRLAASATSSSRSAARGSPYEISDSDGFTCRPCAAAPTRARRAAAPAA